MAIGGAATDSAWLQAHTFCTSIAADLGLTVVTDPAQAPDESGYVTNYSLEQLDVFARADLLILQNLDDPATIGAAWQAVPAVRDGWAVPLDHAHVIGSAHTACAFAQAVGDAVLRLP